jgi:hypothetical protein
MIWAWEEGHPLAWMDTWTGLSVWRAQQARPRQSCPLHPRTGAAVALWLVPARKANHFFMHCSYVLRSLHITSNKACMAIPNRMLNLFEDQTQGISKTREVWLTYQCWTKIVDLDDFKKFVTSSIPKRRLRDLWIGPLHHHRLFAVSARIASHYVFSIFYFTVNLSGCECILVMQMSVVMLNISSNSSWIYK